MIELTLGFLFTLICGGYGFTWFCFTRVSDKIEKLESNHLKHIHERLDKLDGGVDPDDGREWGRDF